MGTTSEKLTYLNVTKQKLKQAINNIGGNIDSETTFREYANQLQNVYDNLPKTEYQEGTEVNLGVTSKGKLDFENGVVGIGQSSQESTEGYNLYKPSTVGMPTYYCTFQLVGDEIVLVSQHDGEIYYGGVSNAGSGYVTQLGPKIPVKPSTTYRISSSSQELSRFFVTKFNSSNISLGFVQANPTFTTDANTSYVTLRAGVYSSTNNTTYRAKIWLYEGSAEKSYEPYTNGASPNPSYEQEIKYVAGRNKLKVDFEAVSVNGIDFSSSEEEITITGTTTASANTIVGQITLPKGSYTLSCTNMAYAWGTSRIEVSGTGIDTLSFFSGTLVRQLTLSQETALTFRAIVSGVGTSVNYKTKIQIEEGTQATPYLPYNTIEETIGGKNLVPFPYSSQAGLISGVNWSVNADGTINANGTADYTSSIFYLCNGDDDLYLDPGTYKISTNVFTDANGFWLQAIQIVNGSYGTVYNNDMVLTERTRLRVRILAKANAVVNQTNGYLMIERGNQATAYEKYKIPKTYQLSLGEYEFAGIGNYVDTIEYDVENDKVYENKNVNEHTFTENENISLQSINSYGIANFFISHSLGSVSNLALCNYFTLQTSGISVTQEEGFLWQHNGVYFRIKSSTASDVSSFKTWLGSHSVKVEYALAETTREEITTTLKDQIKALYYSHSFNGTTIITSNGNLPMIIKVRGLKGE